MVSSTLPARDAAQPTHGANPSPVAGIRHGAVSQIAPISHADLTLRRDTAAGDAAGVTGSAFRRDPRGVAAAGDV